MTGQTISHYRILAKLGEGGMGVVYKAEDTKLKRTVALKFLPSSLAEHKERFLREAQAAAALNHPNICTIFEVDDEHGFIAMELLEGVTVKDKIAERPLPLPEAIDIATQVCAGLQHAHENGIVHRDIKPANLIVNKNGQVKIMDFGLAQVGDRTRITKTGASMGTPAYMSPEQAKGEPADRRTDIWSLGVTLYEMIAGRSPFRGDVEAAVARAIVNDPHEPLTAQRTGLPLEIDRILAKALAKQASERYQSAADLAVDLRSVDPGRRSPTPTGRWRRILPWAVAAAAIVAAFFKPPAASVAPPARFGISLPAGQILVTSSAFHPMAISPDGSKLVYSATTGGTIHLYLRSINSFETQTLPGTEGAMDPFWSPDGQWIGFQSASKLRKVSPAGGAPLVVCDLPGPFRGATWLADGSIVLAAAQAGFWQVPGSGGAPRQILAPDAAKGDRYFWPASIRSGKKILFTIVSKTYQRRLAVFEVGDKNARVILDGQQGEFVSTGHIVFAVEGGLRAVRFDPDRAATIGSPVSLVDDVFESLNGGAAYFAVSSDGTLYYPPGRNEHLLVWADRAGRLTPITNERRGYRLPDLSPDGTRIAVVIDPPDEGNSDIWIFDIARGSFTRLTSEHHNLRPVWSPDGSRIAHYSSPGLSIRALDAPVATVPSASPYEVNYPNAWTRDGGTLLVHGNSPGRGQDVWALALDGTASPRPVVASSFNERHSVLSPNGRWLAYESDETGRYEIYVQPFPAGGRKTALSTGGGTGPRWSRDGSELFYIAGDRIMSIAVHSSAEFKAEKPVMLFERHDVTAGRGEIALGPDRDKFLMVQWDPLSSPREVRVVTNWFAELREKTGMK